LSVAFVVSQWLTYIFITVLTDEQKEMLHDLVDPTAKFFEVSAI
jgi:hypothetical protein